MATPQRRRMRLGELLVAAGVLDDTHLQAALAEQQKWGGKLGRVLVDMGFLSEDLMVRALSKQLGLDRIDLDKAGLDPSVARLLPVSLCERYGLFPVRRDDDLRLFTVATSDPTGYEALDEVSFRTGLKVKPVIAAPSAIDRAVRRYYYGEGTESSRTLDPAAYGLRGAGDVVDLEGAPAPAPVPAPTRATDAASLESMRSALEALEQNMASEVRALRSLIELLVDSGVIDRQAYLAKMRGQ